MKTLSRLLASLAVAALAMFLLAPVANAVPPTPHSFYGTLKINGQDAPIGTVVTARFGAGVTCGTYTTTEAGKYGNTATASYLVVTNDNLVGGDTIRFYVNGVDTGQTASFIPGGGPTQLNLSTGPIHNITTGENFATIQAAIDDADTQNGHVIKIDAGTYTENVNVTRQVTIESTSGNPADTAVVAANPNDHVFEVSADNVTIRNLTIYGANGVDKAGIYFGISTDHGAIANNRAGYDAGHKNFIGIYLSSANDNTVSGNTASFNTNTGIYLNSSSNNTISGNTLSNNWYGINPVSSYINTISGNNVSNNANGIVVEYSNNNTISGNASNSNDNIGIYLDNSGNNTISGNTASSNGAYGIYLGQSDNNAIYLNSLSSATNVFSTSSTNAWQSPTRLAYMFNAQTFKSYLGNYYSTYNGTDANNDGIGEAGYATDGTGDGYPLKQARASYELQTWYLANPTMYKNDMTRSGGTANIAASGNVIWKANAAVTSETVFPAGVQADGTSWTGRIVFDSAPATGHTFTVEVGSSINGSDFTAGGAQATLTGDGSKNAFNYTTNAASFTVQDGKFLALKVTNNSGSAYSLRVGGAWGYVSAPFAQAPQAVPGDANGDDSVNALDITKVERVIAGLDATTPGADANGDGNVNALDITKVERLIVGLDP
ncbi:MAG: right-handed parallel beta-helix repeat-containing protein [Chloroflexi bacterium]|nr:right-handed parallel beta-helix repeat-containing protein [Chloroflexota bacterium]